MKIKKHIPNIISISRIIAAIIIFALFVIVGLKESRNPQLIINFELKNQVSKIWLANTILAIIFGISDFLDGYLARKWNVVSKLGAALDPVSDTIFFWNIMIFLIIFNILSIIPILIYGFREFILLVMRILAKMKNSMIPVNIYGKIKTIIIFPLFIGMLIIFQLNLNNVVGFNFNNQNSLFYLLFNLSLIFPILLAYFSLIISAKQFMILFNKRSKKQKNQKISLK